jgi:hypothetical protein
LVAVERPLEDLLEFADPFDDSQRSVAPAVRAARLEVLQDLVDRIVGASAGTADGIRAATPSTAPVPGPGHAASTAAR